MTKIVDVSITAPDVEWLADHTRKLIELRLVASGNIIPSVRSIYRWQGQIEDESEAYAILHTCDQRMPEIIEVTNAEHPYETVHIVMTEITGADPAYREWIIQQTA